MSDVIRVHSPHFRSTFLHLNDMLVTPTRTQVRQERLVKFLFLTLLYVFPSYLVEKVPQMKICQVLVKSKSKHYQHICFQRRRRFRHREVFFGHNFFCGRNIIELNETRGLDIFVLSWLPHNDGLTGKTVSLSRTSLWTHNFFLPAKQ